jgi:hypothetical protein
VLELRNVGEALVRINEVIRQLSFRQTEKYISHFCVMNIMEEKIEIISYLQVFGHGKCSGILNQYVTGIRLVLMEIERLHQFPLNS